MPAPFSIASLLPVYSRRALVDLSDDAATRVQALFSISMQRTGSRTQKQPLDRKSPIQVTYEPENEIDIPVPRGRPNSGKRTFALDRLHTLEGYRIQVEAVEFLGVIERLAHRIRI
jgi:hypothetical protein